MTQNQAKASLTPSWIKQTDAFANKNLLGPRTSPGAVLTPSITDALQHALNTSEAEGLPSISVGPAQGRFLQLLVLTQILSRSNGVALAGSAGVDAQNQHFHILEVGTLGGYSAIWLAAAHPSVRVTTVEYDEHNARVARANFAHAGLSDRIEVIVGAGVSVLKQLEQDVTAGRRPRIDFSFIDADKENNWAYANHSRKMGRVGTVIVVDNVARRGRLVDQAFVGEDGRGAQLPDSATEEEKAEFNYVREAAMGSRTLVEEVGKEKGLEAGVIQWTEGAKEQWDGFLMGVVVH